MYSYIKEPKQVQLVMFHIMNILTEKKCEVSDVLRKKNSSRYITYYLLLKYFNVS